MPHEIVMFNCRSNNDLTEEKSAPAELSPEHPNTSNNKVLPEINYDRINSFSIIRIRKVMKVGSKPLTEPYRVVTTVPPSTVVTWRRIYDFLSFDEFKLDIKKMLVSELEFYSILMAIAAILGTIFLHGIKKILKIR